MTGSALPWISHLRNSNVSHYTEIFTGESDGGDYYSLGVLMLHSVGCQNLSDYTACRKLLGILDSAITPLFALLTAEWYKGEEQFTRILFWCSFDGVGYIVILAIGVMSYHRYQDII